MAMVAERRRRVERSALDSRALRSGRDEHELWNAVEDMKEIDIY